MKTLRVFIALIFSAFALFSCNNQSKERNNYQSLKTELQEYIDSINAQIGIALIINDTDTLSINGSAPFPMMSVFKFPLALATAKWLDDNHMSFNDTLFICQNALNENTYSPMLKKYGPRDLSLTYHELMEWSLIESDNNACDILIAAIGGVSNTTSLLQTLKVPQQISVRATEDDMHRDNSLSALNSSTPIAMATLFNDFYSNLRHNSESFAEIDTMLRRCNTGLDRLPKPLSGSDAVIGHKTGTGFETDNGGISALNDCGYIILPSGTHYSLAVFIANSNYDITTTSAIIANISQIIYNHLTPIPDQSSL